MGEFQDKVFVVTGGGAGIGRAAALLFAADGAIVADLSRSSANGEETQRLIEQGGGRIVNIGSGSGWGKPNMFAYSTSKGGIFAFSAALAYDYFHQHIRVNTVVPGGGGMPTGMSLGRVGGDPAKLTGAGTAAGRPATGTDIANAVAFLLSPEAETISGTVIDVGCFSHQGGPIPPGARA